VITGGIMCPCRTNHHRGGSCQLPQEDLRERKKTIRAVGHPKFSNNVAARGSPEGATVTSGLANKFPFICISDRPGGRVESAIGSFPPTQKKGKACGTLTSWGGGRGAFWGWGGVQLGGGGRAPKKFAPVNALCCRLKGKIRC